MKFFKKTDIGIVLAIIAVSAIAWLVFNNVSSDRPAKAEIYYYSKLVETVDLTKGNERSFSVPQEQNVVFHVDLQGNISFVKSDCPDKICIHAGKLHKIGQSAACLPNGLVLKIVPLNGRNENDLDAVG